MGLFKPPRNLIFLVLDVNYRSTDMSQSATQSPTSMEDSRSVQETTSLSPPVNIMNNSLAYSPSSAHHLYHQDQEPWSMTSLKREQHMPLMDYIGDIFAEHNYTTDASNLIWQTPNQREIQTQLTSDITISTYPKPPQQMQHQLQHHNWSVP